VNLQQAIIEYLVARGWYFDLERAKDFTWIDAADREREAPAWTVPQWGEYWSSDHLDPVGPKPKSRRYETLRDALWSQLLREEKPTQFEGFFR
jgi:hypothetical protein